MLAVINRSILSCGLLYTQNDIMKFLNIIRSYYKY